MNVGLAGDRGDEVVRALEADKHGPAREHYQNCVSVIGSGEVMREMAGSQSRSHRIRKNEPNPRRSEAAP